ncbi:P-loop containing nucleoside triphosphate hydrolase [Phytophthora cactorum]|nr:P-loop containing nucleoside triphosphate hydrolase [Phytophthora cactorum]
MCEELTADVSHHHANEKRRIWFGITSSAYEPRRRRRVAAAHVPGAAAIHSSLANRAQLGVEPFVIFTRRALQRLHSALKTITGTMTDSDGMRWLQPGERGGERIAIVSYPRCGNSLMRGLLEKVTGVYTGCDTRPDRSLSKELQQYGMKGEGVVDESVWFVKTHFPERVGYKGFPVKKAILVSLHESQYERFADRWDGLLRNEIDVWMKFHRYWTTKVDIPIIVVRYEDLMMHREETLPRSGKIGGSFRHYSEAQFQYILKTANLPLRGFGYDPETQNFPKEISLPKRQVKPGKEGAELLISTDPTMEIRKKNDSFGRGSTYFRRSLTEPVIANDGTELNMDEVLAARERLQAMKEEEATKKLEELTVDDTEQKE